MSSGLPLCPVCGTPLPSDAPEGFCPRCSFHGALTEAREESTPVSPPPQSGEPPGPLASPPPPGVRVRYFGDYELLGELGRGGMGVVYRARQISLNRPVALKMLLHSRFSEEVFVKRFHLEAEAAAHLDHPNIVPIYEIGEHEGQHYFSMKLVEGLSLERELAGSPLAPRRAVQLVATMARAVHYAHQHGVLHRDLKPHNIVLDAQDQPNLTDFGLAKLVEQDTGLTLSQSVMGSPAYMAPEQAAGKTKRLTTAADVYSLGAVLFALVTGKPPFAGQTALETMRQVIERDPVAPHVLNPALDRDMGVICLKCLAKEPARRYGSAEALAEDLERWLRNEPITARRVSDLERLWLWCRRQPVRAGLIAALLVVALLGVGGILSQWNRAERERRSALAAKSRAEQNEYAASIALAQNLIDQRQFDRARRILEATNTAVYRGWEWGWLERTCQEDLMKLSAPGALGFPRFSPDGSLLAAGCTDSTVRVWDFHTGQLRQTLRGHESYAVAPGNFSPDGRRLVTGSWDKTARVWDLATGQCLHKLMHDDGMYCALFSPDGKTVATGCLDGKVRLWDAESAALRGVVADYHKSIACMSYSPDGRWLAFAGGVGLEVRDSNAVSILDLQTGATRTLGEHVGAIMALAFNRDGKRIATGGLDGRACWAELETDTHLRVFFDLQKPEPVFGVDFSPDGRRCAICGEQKVEATVRVIELETGRETLKVRGHSQNVRGVRFSPDGRWLATASFDGTIKIWPAEPLSDYLSLAGHDQPVCALAESPDGKRLATGSLDRRAKIWDLDTGRLWKTLPVGFPVISLAFSPDGSRLATVASDNAAKVWPLNEGDQPLLLRGHTGTVMAVAFSPDDLSIATGSKDCTARVWDSRSGEAWFALTGHTGTVYSVAFSPDGKRIATGSADSTARVWEAPSGRLLLTLKGHKGAVLRLAYSPDGARIATGGRDRTVRLWDATTGAPLLPPLEDHRDGIIALAFSPDGHRLATTGPGTEFNNPMTREWWLNLWDAVTGRHLFRLQPHTNVTLAVAFSHDGTRLITGSADDTARVRRAFSWRTDEYPGSAGDSVGERIEHYKRQYWSRYVDMFTNSAATRPGRRVETRAFGDVDIPAEPGTKTRPLIPLSARDPRATPDQLDLSEAYNVGLTEAWQVVTDLEEIEQPTFYAFPAGLSRLNGILFDVRGIICLTRTEQSWSIFPERVRVPVGRRLRTLHVLHGATYANAVTEAGAVIGNYVLHFADGQARECEIRRDREVRDWWVSSAPQGDCENGTVAWKGPNPVRPGELLQVFKTSYSNPRPEVEVTSIEFVSKRTQAAPFLLGMTVE